MNSNAIRLALALCISASIVPHAPALALSDSAQADQPSTSGLFLSLIRQAREDGNSRAALAFLDDFDRQYPGNADAQVLRINCLLDLGQVAEAQAAVANLSTRKPSGTAYAARGHVFAAQGSWEQAIAEYRMALQTIPSDILTNNALGYAQMRAGEAGAAIETLKRARELAPTDPVIRNNLVLALTVAGRVPEADALLARSGSVAFQTELRRQVAEEIARISTSGEAKP